MPQGSILVVGSLNMDLVVRAPSIPLAGETVLGSGSLETLPGGKGANQAVAIARLGGWSILVGRVGRDAFGSALIESLESAGVDCANVLPTSRAATGAATIVVDASGQNAIAVAVGANATLGPEDVDALETVIASASLCLVQLEIPTATVLRVISQCRRHDVRVVLDPAPAPAAGFPPDLLHVDVLTPNEREACQLTGLPLGTPAADLARALHATGAKSVVVTLGARGVFFRSDEASGEIPAHAVTCIDTTATGDVFAGALALALVEKKRLPSACRFANAAAALACTRAGAQASIPARADVDALLTRSPTQRERR